MIVLFDFDSMIYKSVYKIVSISDIKKFIIDGLTRDEIEYEILNESVNRLLQMKNDVLVEIEDTGIVISSEEYYVTKSTNCYRRSIYPEYKANRKAKKSSIGKWVSMVRDYLIKGKFAIVNDRFEADDLIADRAIEIGFDGCIICSLDKDFKTIEGIHFDYYRKPREKGSMEQNPCNGLDVVSSDEAYRFLFKQVLMGDATDNIKGLKGVGKVRAEKILDSGEDYKELAMFAYIDKYEDIEEASKQFNLNYELVRLGTKDRLGFI